MAETSSNITTNNHSNIVQMKFAKMNNIIKEKSNDSANNMIIQDSRHIKYYSSVNNYLNRISLNNKEGENTKKETNIFTKTTINNKNNNKLFFIEQYSITTANFIDKNKFLMEMNRLCTDYRKIMINIILFIYSLFFIGLNIFDFLNYKKSIIKNNRDISLLINNILIFILQIIYSLCLLIFQGIIFFINQKENRNVVFINIITIILLTLLRIIIYAIKNNNKLLYISINFIYSIFMSIVNIIFLGLLFLANKKQKNVLHNIDEIVKITGNLNNINKNDDIKIDSESKNDIQKNGETIFSQNIDFNKK